MTESTYTYCCCQVTSVVSDSVWPHGLQPTRLLRPWDSPGKNTGVGFHFLLQCMKVESESEVTQSCLTLRDPMDCSLPGSSVYGIFRATLLEWGAIAFSHIYLLVNCKENQAIILWSTDTKERICEEAWVPLKLEPHLHHWLTRKVIKELCSQLSWNIRDATRFVVVLLTTLPKSCAMELTVYSTDFMLSL